MFEQWQVSNIVLHVLPQMCASGTLILTSEVSGETALAIASKIYLNVRMENSFTCIFIESRVQLGTVKHEKDFDQLQSLLELFGIDRYY